MFMNKKKMAAKIRLEILNRTFQNAPPKAKMTYENRLDEYKENLKGVK